jgi:hypothetical protein
MRYIERGSMYTQGYHLIFLYIYIYIYMQNSQMFTGIAVHMHPTIHL